MKLYPMRLCFHLITSFVFNRLSNRKRLNIPTNMLRVSVQFQVNTLRTSGEIPVTVVCQI